jgi:hypothetical protein
MICCVCQTNKWKKNRDISYYFDTYAIETFYKAYNAPIVALDDMIQLISSYQHMLENIRLVIESRHSNQCRLCRHCGSCKGSTAPPLDDDALDPMIAYYSGLSIYQTTILDKLTNCLTSMQKISGMIGMEDIKTKFVTLLKYLSTVDVEELKAGNHLMHMVITGPPGHGKTEIAKLLGNAFQRSGLLTSDKFVLGTRANLIGKYCGWTAKATTAVFDEARGGVLFIDEVYSLGNPEKRDVFTGECINTINQLLSERSDTLCIIAGYEEEIETCFFSYNPGLKRRFPPSFRFDIKSYSTIDLVNIFNKKVIDMGYAADPNVFRPKDIEQHKDKFGDAGGDIANLITSCTMAHYQNSFLQNTGSKLTREDVKLGLKNYLANKKAAPKDNPPPQGMYT